MPRKNDSQYLLDKIRTIDDEAFAEVAAGMAEKSADVSARPKDELIHLIELEDDLADVRKSRGQFRGYSTGYRSLDAKMGGLERGSVCLVAGETSHGKSALVTNIAMNLSKISGLDVPTLYISLEMTLRQMLERLDLVAGGELPPLNLVFQKSFALSYRDLEPLVRRAKQDHDIKVVVIDYLQYLGRGMTHEETAKMSKEVKALALNYDICMVVITSVRKGSTEAKFRRQWTEITVDDLMGTSAIAYDADQIVLVSRKNLEGEYDNEHIHCKVLKTRNAPLDFKAPYVQLTWDRTKITETA